MVVIWFCEWGCNQQYAIYGTAQKMSHWSQTSSNIWRCNLDSPGVFPVNHLKSFFFFSGVPGRWHTEKRKHVMHVMPSKPQSLLQKPQLRGGYALLSFRSCKAPRKSFQTIGSIDASKPMGAKHPIYRSWAMPPWNSSCCFRRPGLLPLMIIIQMMMTMMMMMLMMIRLMLLLFKWLHEKQRLCRWNGLFEVFCWGM